MDYRQWARRFSQIGAALTEARSLDELLETILRELRDLTSSDAGSIYRVIVVDGEEKLQFENAQNDTIELPDQRFTLEIDRTSLAGYSAYEAESLNIEDVYEIDSELPYSFSSGFDDETGYQTRSMLVVPLNNRHGEVKGILQLINRKQDFSKSIFDTEILPFDEELQQAVVSLASQAAVAMERAELEDSVERMLESMVQTLVTALDRRDEITTGHSQRLTQYAMKLIKKVDAIEEGAYSAVSVEEWEQNLLYYSGLLHDIGKIAVPEDVLNKENRLTDDRIEAIQNRFAYIEASGQGKNTSEIMETIREINESGYLEPKKKEFLKNLREQQYEDLHGHHKPWLNEEEYHHLSIEKGNLTVPERKKIQHHAHATYEILKGIEWTEDLKRVPRLASMHHEKLDGSGYPRGLESEEIPLLARVLCVVDIYEALTARDRPYKPAMDPETAREILEEEAENGHLDPELVDLFFGEEIHLSLDQAH
mgnify:CR=1 FL=1